MKPSTSGKPPLSVPPSAHPAPARADTPYPEVLPADGSAPDYPAVLPAEPFAEVLPVEEVPVLQPADEVTSVEDNRGLTPPARRLGVWRRITSGCEWVFGAISLMVGLAVLAPLPLLQFFTFGYLLEAGGRVARTGRLREGFPGVRMAARLGGIVLGAWLVMLPLQAVSSLWVSAQIIDPYGLAARRWKAVLMFLTIAAAFHIMAACSRGGRLRYFFWPFNLFWLIRRWWRGGYYTEARDAVWNLFVSLRLPYYFWLGLRGFVGSFLWLAVPVTLFALGRQAPLLGFVGALLLAWVVLYMPFLQIHFAVANRFRELFNLRAVRAAFARAPWAFGFALLITLLFALPLYLLKIEMIPREAAWLPSLIFMAFIFPARLLTGWAFGRARRRPLPRHWFFRWTSRLGMVPVALVYVLLVFFTQYTVWGGIWSLYEQHAFLLPVPFFGM
ncbi:MAG: hypothetical protein JO112_24080 [Planctomycetes bacterium]|nr:hypothetical protein [Planctomycetota bacterium]